MGLIGGGGGGDWFCLIMPKKAFLHQETFRKFEHSIFKV